MKNKKLRRKLGGLLAALLLVLPVSAYESIPVTLNGRPTRLDARLIASTTYVPVGQANELFGSAVENEIEVEALPGKPYIAARGRYLGGAECLEADGEIFVPIRSLAKVYGASVDWNDGTRSISLTAVKGPGIEAGDDFYISDEVYWLSRIINAESADEPMIGKILVGNVIHNRMFSDEFPNSIYDVIFDRKFGVQFSPIISGAINRTPNADSVIAAKICLDAYYVSREALYFLNPRIASNLWIPANRSFIISVGGHDFYS